MYFLFLQIVFQVDASTQKSEESETFDVELTKNVQGLKITIAGYIGDKKLGSFLNINILFLLSWQLPLMSLSYEILNQYNTFSCV